MPNPLPYPHGYRCAFWHKGTRHRRRFPAAQYANPAEACRAYIASVLGHTPPPTRTTLNEQIRAYLAWCETTGKKQPSTLDSDRRRLETFLNWTTAAHAALITAETLRDFQAYFYADGTWYKGRPHRRRGNRHNTWEKYRLILSAFFNWCRDRGFADSNPADRPEFKAHVEQNLPDRIYSPEELLMLWDELDRRNSAPISAFFRTLAYAGLRLSEGINLEWACVDMDRRTITIPRRTRNKPGRVIPLVSQLAPWIERLDRTGRYVFSRPDGSRLYTKDYWYKLWVQAHDALGIPRGRVHNIRHTFCTLLHEAGVELVEIQKLAGHRRLETTLRYTHTNPRRLKSAIDKLPY